MPYTMTHLIIANEFPDKSEFVDNLGKYFLGSISPDAVHMRKRYHNSLKAASHLCCQQDKWGKIEDVDAWLVNVYKKAKEYRYSVNYDFLVGYLVHIITDLFYDIHVTQIYRKNYLNFTLSEQDYRNLDLVQNNYDTELYENYYENTMIFFSLKETPIEHFLNIVTSNDIQLYREKVLQRYELLEYKDIDFQDKYVHLRNEDNYRFIQENSSDIYNVVSDIIHCI